MATITLPRPGKEATPEAPKDKLTAQGVKLGFSWREGGKTRRVSGLEPTVLAQALEITPDQLYMAIAELSATRGTAQGASGRERTPAQKQREREYREARKAAMTDEQRESERTKRQAYNAKKNAEIKQALALLREQEAAK